MQIFDLTVNRPRAINHTNARHETEAPARIYNDVHFRPRNQVICDSWALFPQLLPELRLHIWQVFLQQHRMIELGIRADGDENGPQSHYYTDRNHLGNIVSGRNYSLTISGRGYTASLSPLLRVSSEARQAALDFYRVQLPFPLRDGERVLYLNPEYDVLYVRPEFRSPNMPPTDVQPKPRAASVLVDFLHDARAYDPKDKGVAHLALHAEYQNDFLEDSSTSSSPSPPLVPAILHPTAATSFAEILRSGRLRSVFCVVGFRGPMRGMTEFPMPGWRYHFAQTFPLRRRGAPAGAFSWFETDPRPGVELDLSQVPLSSDPRCLARAWGELEKAFGVERRRSRTDDDDNFAFYICPTLSWPSSGQLIPGSARRFPEGSREELAEHLRQEAEDWDRGRDFISGLFPLGYAMPRHGTIVDVETFEIMERAPSTAVGMWVFTPDAFEEPTNVQRSCFDVSAVRPGLLLFEV